MKITFQLINDQEIKIWATDRKGVKKQVGQIFTPSGSGHTYTNAIQVCGFREAFDLWGCAVYATPASGEFLEGYKKRYKNSGRAGKIYEQAKDIQLVFGLETIPHKCGGLKSICLKCYNNPCTCEIHIKHENPYMVKRCQDLYLETKEKPLLEGK